MVGRRSMGSEVQIWRRDHFWMFLLSSHLISFVLFIGSRPGINGVGTGFFHLLLEVEFPRAPDQPKGRPEWYRSVAGLMISYEYVRGMIV